MDNYWSIDKITKQGNCFACYKQFYVVPAVVSDKQHYCVRTEDYMARPLTRPTRLSSLHTGGQGVAKIDRPCGQHYERNYKGLPCPVYCSMDGTSSHWATLVANADDGRHVEGYDWI